MSRVSMGTRPLASSSAGAWRSGKLPSRMERPGAGAGLHHEVAALLHRLGDLGRHLHLAVALLPAEGDDRGAQHLADGGADRGRYGGGLGHQSTLRGGADAPSYAVHSRC